MLNGKSLPRYTEWQDGDTFGASYGHLLERAKYSISEDGLIQAINEDKSKNKVAAAAYLLKKYGTEKSLPVLKGLMNYPMRDVKAVAILSIGAIAGAGETEYYASLVDDPKCMEKGYAMITISEVGDRRAMLSVQRYAEKILGGNISIKSHPGPHLFVVQYLERFPDVDNRELIEKLRQLPSESF